MIRLFMRAEENFGKKARDIYPSKEESYAKKCNFQPLIGVDIA